MGPKAIVSGEPLAEYLKDALHLYTHGEPIDSLIQYIGLTGLQYAGVCHLYHKPKSLCREDAFDHYTIFRFRF